MLCIMCIFSLSVSESKEWVCTKTVFSNGTIVRGCEKTYTGKSRSAFIPLLLQCSLLCLQEEKQYLSVSGAIIKVKVL